MKFPFSSVLFVALSSINNDGGGRVTTDAASVEFSRKLSKKTKKMSEPTPAPTPEPTPEPTPISLDAELEAILRDIHYNSDSEIMNRGFANFSQMRSRHAAGNISDGEKAALTWDGRESNGVHEPRFDIVYDLMKALANDDVSELLGLYATTGGDRLRHLQSGSSLGNASVSGGVHAVKAAAASCSSESECGDDDSSNPNPSCAASSAAAADSTNDNESNNDDGSADDDAPAPIDDQYMSPSDVP